MVMIASGLFRATAASNDWVGRKAISMPNSSMAVTIMGGLGFATLLTLLAVPCLYLLFMRVKPEET